MAGYCGAEAVKPKQFTEAVSEALWGPRVEPDKRLVGGSFGWAYHRFPIKGGISLTDTLIRDMNAPNPLYERLVRRSK